MMLKKIETPSISAWGLIVGFIFSLLAVQPARAEDNWIQAWKDYAAKSGDAGHKAYADAIASPEARELDQAWTEFRGYNASTLMEKANLPKDLKPGLVINKENMDKLPWLKDYLRSQYSDRLKSTGWYPWSKAVIVPTSHYYMHKWKLEATKAFLAAGGSAHVNEKGEVLDNQGKYFLLEQAALPFAPKPKNGLELNWLYVSTAVGVDDFMFEPIKMYVCDSNNSSERIYEAHLWWQKFHGRTEPHVKGPHVGGKDGLIEGGAVYFTQPFDVRGLAGVRLRNATAGKEDDFKVFIPSLRRTRVLAGSDAQDPIAAGTELTWDEWRAYWQKTDPDNFSYDLVGETWVLAQPEVGHFYDPAATTDEKKCGVDTVELELRPVWVLEQKDKSGRYQYSKRISFIDKEYYYNQVEEMYDRKGNLWRTWDDARDWDPKTGLMMWRNVLEWNTIANRSTELTMRSAWDDRKVKTNNATFDIDQLRDYQ